MIHSSCIAFPSYQESLPLEKHEVDLGRRYQNLEETLTYALLELDNMGKYHAAIHINAALILLFGEDSAAHSNNDLPSRSVI